MNDSIPIKKQPAWMKRALNPNTPMTEARETIQTISIDGRLFPTVRMIDGKLKKLSVDDAYNMAMEKKDFIEFDTDKAATSFSKMLSKMVGKKRQKTIMDIST
tara:strand:- start:132 stop:440 length:309 start_codon:yes stop_codon:yes gene_type:complete